MIRAANGYIDRQAPWALNKTDKARMGGGAARAGRHHPRVATLLQPVMPGSMARMLDQLGVPAGRARHSPRWPTPLADGRCCRRRRACSRAMWSRRVA